MIQEITAQANKIIKKSASQKQLEKLQKANLRKDIQDLKEKLLHKSTEQPRKGMNSEEHAVWNNERRNTERVIRNALKDKLTTHDCVVEAEKIILKQ